MPKIWIKKACVQVFNFESITFKEDFNMFECMEVSESVYEVLVETSYNNTTRAYSNRSGYISKLRGEAALSNTYSKIS